MPWHALARRFPVLAIRDFRLLLAGTLVMAAIVITGNRVVWRRLYALAEARFRLD